MTPKALADLEWARLLEALAARCETAMGRREAEALDFAEGDAARERLREAEEGVRLRDHGAELPLTVTEDVDDAVERLRVGGVLAPSELRAIAALLGSARALRRFLSAKKDECPTLVKNLTTDPTLDRLADEVASAFDADGTLKDSATPELKRLREERMHARGRILGRLDEVMRKYERVLQDRFVTEREGRFVLPVRADSHERFPGIVHSSSASGATIFVEPRAIIPLGNRLKMLEADVLREELAVYARLSDLLAGEFVGILTTRNAVARADVLRAIVRLSGDLQLRFPDLRAEPRLELYRLRHPLLALEAKEVIPSDLTVEGGKVLVVSGPNAGGKTVALKALGLAALMLRAGLPIPCGDGSVASLFDSVLTDVGDDQSLAKNLSTFSAHVKNLAEMVRTSGKRTLVLLDELCGGTDPREGEALAIAVLDALAERGAAIAATTHYEGLKVMAAGDARFRNASVSLEEKTMEPTFFVSMDIPGRSSALVVAERFGLPREIVTRAEKLLAKETLDYELAVRRIHEERAALELARDSFTRKEAELEAKRLELEDELARARDREGRMLSEQAKQLLALVRRSKEEVRTAELRLRKRHIDSGEVKEAARSIEKAARSLAVGGELESLLRSGEPVSLEPPRPADLRVGGRVYVPRLRTVGEILEIAHDGTMRVAVGPLKVRVTEEELRKAPTPDDEKAGGKSGGGGKASSAPKHKGGHTKPSAKSPEALEVAIPTDDNTCDLRGLRVDDGVSMAMTFLDRALSQGSAVIFLLHGHGTGAMKDAIRKELKGHPNVAHFRPAAQVEGGDGVTVVWIS